MKKLITKLLLLMALAGCNYADKEIGVDYSQLEVINTTAYAEWNTYIYNNGMLEYKLENPRVER